MLCWGNDGRRDDGLGPALAEALRVALRAFGEPGIRGGIAAQHPMNCTSAMRLTGEVIWLELRAFAGSSAFHCGRGGTGRHAGFRYL